jgi:hypothetical protein
MKRGVVRGIPEFAAEAGCTTNNRSLEDGPIRLI